MIPLLYKLRNNIRFEISGDAYLVISETPLKIVKVNERAVKILNLCNGKTLLKVIAKSAGVSEEHAFKICDYFNSKGMLEIKQARTAEKLPFVSVIIPNKDRKKELKECLKSVFAQDYPKNKLEVIVIDDGSTDGSEKISEKFPVKSFRNDINRGQSFCRNLGSKKAKGTILAFIDSDCVASKTWLKELTAYFQWKGIGAVGGFVDGYYKSSGLDRYETAMSSLNMGKHLQFSGKDDNTFYVPTCNFLVRKKVYNETGGINENLHVGEDVDFCWRMRNKGYRLLYAPHGSVKHKHRNVLLQMLKRRADYGTSEAVLYSLHKNKKKILPAPVLSSIAFLGFCASILTLSFLPLLIPAVCYFSESIMKIFRIRRMYRGIKPGKIFLSIMRSYFSLFYYLSFHLTRYYLIVLFLIGIFYFPVWFLALLMILLSSSVDYAVKKPQLNYPYFLFFNLLEYTFYQAGVFKGCLRARTFRSYKISPVKKIA